MIFNCTYFLIFFLFLLCNSVHGERATPPPPPTDQCNKTVGIYEEISSPPLTPDNYGKPMLCSYRFRPFRTNLRDWVLRIRFTKFKVGRLYNDSTCESGYIQIIDGNGKFGGKTGPQGGKFCGEIEQEQTFISETNSVRLIFQVDNFTSESYFRFDSRAEQQYEVYLRYGQNPELYPNRRGEVIPNTYCERVFRDCRMQTCYVQSPGYPGLYPRGVHCKYQINTRLPFIKLHIENEEINVDGARCDNLLLCPIRPISTECPNDYIRIHDGKDERSPVIGTFCGLGKFPHSIIGTGSDIFMEFVSSAAGPLSGNTGFHFNVGHWPGHVETSGKSNGSCNWIFSSRALSLSGDKQGLFWSVSHWYPPGTRCSYLMLGERDEIVRLLFPSFRIDKVAAPIAEYSGECAESLTIYDGSTAEDGRIIKTFCDTSRPLEKYDFVSSSNALYVVFESKSGSYAGSSLYYWATYDFFNDTKFGTPVANTVCDQVFYSWDKPYGQFISPLNSLIYKTEDKVISCRYRFVSLKRLYARVLIRIDSANFKYNQDSCLNCWSDRVDKLMVLDPGRKNASRCICKENQHQHLPAILISGGEEGEVLLKIDPRHAVANYFKSNIPIFTGTYKFIHGPLCGPTTLGPSQEGKLKFPFFYNPNLRDAPVHCVWELQTGPSASLFLTIQRLVFSSTSCAEGKLEFFLNHHHSQRDLKRDPSPLLTLCGDASNSPTSISSQLPILPPEKLQSLPVTIKLEASSAAKINFIITWTELHALPKNPDGSLRTLKLEDENCGFLCPGMEGVCIGRGLVCNGVQNCPNSTGLADEDSSQCKFSDNNFVVLNYNLNVDWYTASGVGGGVALLLGILVVWLCGCRRKEREVEMEDYLT